MICKQCFLWKTDRAMTPDYPVGYGCYTVQQQRDKNLPVNEKMSQPLPS